MADTQPAGAEHVDIEGVERRKAMEEAVLQLLADVDVSKQSQLLDHLKRFTSKPDVTVRYVELATGSYLDQAKLVELASKANQEEDLAPVRAEIVSTINNAVESMRSLYLKEERNSNAFGEAMTRQLMESQLLKQYFSRYFPAEGTPNYTRARDQMLEVLGKTHYAVAEVVKSVLGERFYVPGPGPDRLPNETTPTGELLMDTLEKRLSSQLTSDADHLSY